MKTTTNRSHPNGAKKTFSREKTHRFLKLVDKPGRPSGYAGTGGICLAIFDQDADTILAGAEITAAQLEEIKIKAAKNCMSIGALLGFAVKGMVHAPIASDVMDAAEHVNKATDSANTLFELIETHLDWREHRGDGKSGLIAEKFNSGLTELTQKVREESTVAAAQMLRAAYGQPTP